MQPGGPATVTIGGVGDAADPDSRLFVLEKGAVALRLSAAEVLRADAPLADIPTWKEIGYDVSVSAWRGVIGPPGLKPEEIDFWQKGFEGFMKSDEYKKSAKEEIFEARYLNAADSAKFLADMDAQFRDYLTLVGAK